ncbi:hypothetical protein [Craterilacuibacter sp.]|jgi:hypothetical protein
MGKIRQSTKEAKKPAAMTAKEKKAAKAIKKNPLNIAPIIPR